MKKKFQMHAAFLMILLVILAAAPAAAVLQTVPVSAATYKSEFVQKNGKWYYYNSAGKLCKGWCTTKNGYIYYFGTDGAAMPGLQKIGSNYYYFSQKGLAYTGRKKIGSYWYAFDKKTGAMIRSGWYKESGKYYYAASNGKLVTGLRKFGSKTRYFYPTTCAMATGWVKYNGGYYFFTSKGYRLEGKVTATSGKMYYFSPNGRLYQNRTITTSAGKYFAKSNGVLATGWLQYKNNKYYFDSKGIMKTGWVKISGYYYYFSPSSGALAVNKWVDNTHYVGSDGKYLPAYSKQLFIWPLPSNWNQVSSKFGPRESPGGIGSTNHQGIDIAAPTGTPIYAIAAGTVSLMQTPSQSGGGGNYTVIDHGSGIKSGYMHQSKFAAGIKVGVKVKKGQLIGYVGTTGNVTGPHLHLELSRNGVKLDPLKYIKQP